MSYPFTYEMTRLRVVLSTLCLVSLLSLHTTSAQELTVGPNSAEFGAFSGRRDFERFCIYNGAPSQLNALQWLLNGTVFISTEATTLQLLIRPVNFSHAGNWTCRAVKNDGSSEEVNGGCVYVFDPNDVIAPPKQYALIGQPYTFNCSSVIPNQMSFVSWLRSGETGSTLDLLITSSAQLSDEGVYICRVSVLDTSLEMSVQLGVVVPPMILSFPSLSGQIFTNEPVTLTVNFESHTQEITSVRWFKNDVRINSDDINTTYGASPNATTQLEFTQITRENRGTYRVEIENSADVIPSNMRTVVKAFDVNVQVPPSLPENVMFTPFNDTHVMITWTLTNETPDAGAETLTLHLENHPNSPFVLEPTQNEWILYSEPGMTYLLSLKASNPDGMVTTTPMTVMLPAKAPRVESFRALRVNSTSFNLTLSVIYTGGGDIETFAVSFQEPGSNQMSEATLEIPLQSQTTSNLWYAVVTNALFASIEEPEFEVNIRNTMGQSTVQPLVGESVLPGPPNVLLVSKSSNMLDLRIEISYIGTAPITMVQMNVTTATSSQIISSFEQSGNYVQGQLISASVMDLEPSTTYICRARAMNSVGTGNPSMEFEFVTDDSPSKPAIPSWTIIVIAVVGSIILAAIIVTAILCLIYCCRKSPCKNSGKYNTSGGPYVIGTMPDEIKNSNETLNSISHRGSVRGGVVGAYTQVNVPLTPRSPTIESCDSPYIKQRFESVTDSDGSRSDIQLQYPHYPRHYTYSHSPGPATVANNAPMPLNFHNKHRLSRSLTAFDEPTSPQDITHQATMV